MAIAMGDHGVQAVRVFKELLEEMMGRAQAVKKTDSVEPALNKPDIADLVEKLELKIYGHAKMTDQRKSGYAIVETAFRDRFYDLLAVTDISSTSFAQVWNLLDIISILSDTEQCDPALLLWLVEELLDSQTIAGCRKVFDYLESRRERITAKHFGQKNLIILRSCNELLRRLSRAEDTAFCGRVFVFMFQSFPLGDKSSVNLRGEFHLENVTSYNVMEARDASLAPDSDKMDVDGPPPVAPKAVKKGEKPNGKAESKESESEPPLSAEALYPIFWSLQESFSQPKRLFDQSNFTGFKAGLEATMAMFETVKPEPGAAAGNPADEVQRGVKRKRSQSEDELANAFNPKYLTSRDLFELEISDITFRRNICVQVLIVMEFLLSLSASAKEKFAPTLSGNHNKSVVYADQLFSEEDTKWVQDQKAKVVAYLKLGQDGPFFMRMVDTVLSRDKNWVRWKIENCQPISKPSTTPKDYTSAKAAVTKLTSNKRLRPTPLGSLDLKFLVDTSNKNGLERLKDPSRYSVPSVESFRSKIELDDMDIDMARTDEEKNAAIDAKISKSWRALRLASTTKITAFDKIEKSDKIDAIFQEDSKAEEVGDDSIDISEEVTFPKDGRSVVISGPNGVEKGILITKLLEKHPAVFGKKASHTTRPPRTGEVHGTHYYFVNKQEFDVLRDGDEFIEINNHDGNDYGTSRKIIDGIIAKGKVPVMEMDYHQCKDAGFAARYIFLAPPGSDLTEHDQRFRRREIEDEDKIKGRLEIAKEEIDRSKAVGFHKILVNDDLEASYKSLEDYVFGNETAEDSVPVEGAGAAESTDAAAAKEDGLPSDSGVNAVEALSTETSTQFPTKMET
ncbi:guanylate kinase [Calycina marina]|uniref:Guanylate kinase n=1 Tax=Calycina marina TaxID=1763456 RepID=A0A9P7Z1Z9_9HELO|nr:guanylate kinase [Calycina marina]